MSTDNKNKMIHVRVSNAEYERLGVLAKQNNLSVSDYVRDMTLCDGSSLVQLRNMLTEMENTLSNILLAEKIISANATEMFRNLSIRIKVGDRNPKSISQEEGEEINKSIETSINIVKTKAMDSVVKHYTDTKAPDPVYLDVFAKKVNESLE